MAQARRAAIGALVGLALGCVVAAAYEAGWTERYEHVVSDLCFRLRPLQPDSGQVVVVGITDECIDEIGPMPWPRETYGRAIDRLRAMGASVICLDIFFPPRQGRSEPERRAYDLDDERLAQAMRRAGNVVLPVFDEVRGTRSRIVHAFRPDRAATRGTVRFRDNARPLTEAAAAIGHINVTPDSDGVARRVAVEVWSTARRYTELGVVAGAEHLRLHGVAPERRGAVAKLGHLSIPCDERGNVLFNWRPDGAWVRGHNLLRFSDLYRGRVKAPQIAGKVVFIGQCAPGLPNADLLYTPFRWRFGLIGQADVAESVVTGRYARPCGSATQIALILLVAVLGGAVFFSLRLYPVVAATALLLPAVVGANVLVFNRSGVLLGAVPSSLSVLLVAVASIAFALVRARAEVGRREGALDMLRLSGQETADLLQSASGHAEGEVDLLEGMGSFAASLRIPEITPPAVLRSLTTALGAAHGFMCLEENGQVRWLSTGEDGPTAERARELASVLIPLAASGGQGVAVPSLRGDRALRPFADAVRTALAVRLTLGKRPLGTVALCGKEPTAISPGREFEESDLRIAAALAGQGSLLLDQARLHRGLYVMMRRAVGTLAAAIDAKDPFTHGHSERVALFSVFLARALNLSEQTVEAVELGALLHDVGKIGLDEAVLRGSTQLGPEEWALVKQHPGIGSAIFAHMEELSFLMPALRHHHERYDGTGYPDGLVGQETPLLARLIAVADAFDAMTFARTYRTEPLSFEEAVQELRRCSGSQFDPGLAECFVRHATPDLVARAGRRAAQAGTVRPAVAAAPGGGGQA